MCSVYIDLKELETVVLIVFNLSDNVVALYLDNCTAKAFICNQGHATSPFQTNLLHTESMLASSSSHSSSDISIKWKWICWYPHIWINFSILKPWKIYPWKPKGWTLPKTPGHYMSYVFPPDSLFPLFLSTFLFLTLSGSGRDDFSIYKEGLQAMLERTGRLLCYIKRVYQTMSHMSLQLTDFFSVC